MTDTEGQDHLAGVEGPEVDTGWYMYLLILMDT